MLFRSAQNIASAKKGVAFFDSPKDFSAIGPYKIRAWLQQNGFIQVKKAVVVRTANGVKRTDTSEIWYRERPLAIQGTQVETTGQIEALRLDEWGHDVPSHFAGAKPHVHTDTVSWAESQAYLNIFVPELPAAYRGGVPVPKYTPDKPFDGTAKGKQDPTNPTYFPDTHQRIKKNL